MRISPEYLWKGFWEKSGIRQDYDEIAASVVDIPRIERG